MPDMSPLSVVESACTRLEFQGRAELARVAALLGPYGLTRDLEHLLRGGALRARDFAMELLEQTISRCKVTSL